MRLLSIAAPPLSIFGLHKNYQGDIFAKVCFKIQNIYQYDNTNFVFVGMMNTIHLKDLKETFQLSGKYQYG